MIYGHFLREILFSLQTIRFNEELRQVKHVRCFVLLWFMPNIPFPLWEADKYKLFIRHVAEWARQERRSGKEVYPGKTYFTPMAQLKDNKRCVIN